MRIFRIEFFIHLRIVYIVLNRKRVYQIISIWIVSLIWIIFILFIFVLFSTRNRFFYRLLCWIHFRLAIIIRLIFLKLLFIWLINLFLKLIHSHFICIYIQQLIDWLSRWIDVHRHLLLATINALTNQRLWHWPK